MLLFKFFFIKNLGRPDALSTREPNTVTTALAKERLFTEVWSVVCLGAMLRPTSWIPCFRKYLMGGRRGHGTFLENRQ